MATCSGDYKVKIWNPNTNWDLIRSYSGHSDWVVDLEFIDDDTIATGSFDGIINIWSIRTGLTNRYIQTGYLSSFQLLNDGLQVAAGLYNGNIRIFNLNTNNLIATLNGHKDQVNDLVLMESKAILASSSSDGTVRLWDLNNYQIKFILMGHTNIVYGLKLISNDVLCSGSWDMTIKMWNVTSGESLKTLTGHTSWIEQSLDVFSDGQTLMSGSWDHTIKLWNLNTGQCLNTINTGLQIDSLSLIERGEGKSLNILCFIPK